MLIRHLCYVQVCSWSSLSSSSTGRGSFERNSLDKGSSSAPPQRHSTVTNALNVDVGQLLHQEMIAGGTHKLVKCTAANSMATPPGRGGVHGGAAVQY